MRFFGSKPKNSKLASKDTQNTTGDRHVPTPIHEQLAIYTKNAAVSAPGLYPNSHLRDNMRQSPSDDQSLEVVSNIDDAAHSRVLAPSRASTLPSRTSPPLHSPPLQRSPSPFNVVNNKNAPAKDRETPQVLRRKHPPNAPATLGILRALDPSRHGEIYSSQPSQTQSEERPPSINGGLRERDREAAEKKEKRGFWGTTKDRPWIERSKDKDQKDDAELTRMIGYLTATASEDWTLVLEVCDRASSNETNAKEAVRALRREFKYGEPAAQLSAARLWAIMSRNCSGFFVAETSSRKFVSTLEDLIGSTRTPPVVRERLLEVVAAAAYNSPKDSSFRNLWRRVKPADKPEEGIPFDLNDEMINPPAANLRRSQIEINAPLANPSIPFPPNTPNVRPNTPPRNWRSPAREQIISLEEDIRRLFQECHIGMGNAALLSDALVTCKPERLKTDAVIREFYMKCCASQELIDSQIPWATAGAEHSRMSKSRTSQPLRSTNDSHADDDEQTIEEKLLGDLLKANEELQFVLKQYNDLERVALERQVESLIKTTQMEPQDLQYQDPDGWCSSGYSQNIDETPSRSPSPSIQSETPPCNSYPHDRSQTSLDIQGQLLAPPPAAPHGPRSPQPSLTSRTSPGIVVHDQRQQIDSHATRIPDVHDQSTASNIRLVDHHIQPILAADDVHEIDGRNLERVPVRPSAKALGKRRLVERIATNFDLDEPSDLESSLCTSDRLDSDPEEEERDAWLHPPVKYVYDAAAERTHQRIQQATAAMMVNGVH